MITTNIRAERPTLSLPFGRTNFPGSRTHMSGASTLSGPELRRIVSEMLG